MVSCSDDVRHMTDESSARIHQGRRAVRRGSIRTNLQPQLQGDPLTASGGANLQIPSARLFKRNERYSYLNILRDSSHLSSKAASSDVRLVGGTSSRGRLEVLRPDTKQWGTVCADGFGLNEAKTFCRMLCTSR
ncbi:unnamed protein product [Protopolystoma xenopodis]|uniref:SRCR domain-containing protein n=1 Tax=Protopolystoma xenopodis TaxID=117903 RepID=A0A3S4ZZ79_9PLAT|nr:unnamed protein product [Protopolystoma xenopodis]